MLVDKITSGFLAWDSTMEAYSVPVDSSLSHVWEPDSRPALDSIESFISQGSYFSQLILLWAQEETDSRGDLELRLYNVRFMKSLGGSSDEIMTYYIPDYWLIQQKWSRTNIWIK